MNLKRLIVLLLALSILAAPASAFDLDDLLGASPTPSEPDGPGETQEPSPSVPDDPYALDEDFVETLDPGPVLPYEDAAAEWARFGLVPYAGADIQGVADIGGDVILADRYNDVVPFTVTAPSDGLYLLHIRYQPQDDSLGLFAMAVEVNGEVPFLEAGEVMLPKYWFMGGGFFDRKADDSWRDFALRDTSGRVAGLLPVPLRSGENTITLRRLRESVNIAGLTVSAPPVIPNYWTYRAKRDGPVYNGELLTYEAEEPLLRNGNAIAAIPDSDPLVTPQVPGRRLNNTIGGTTWQRGGTGLFYIVNAPADGYYRLTFRSLNNFLVNMPVFRTIEINGEVPFAELLTYPFPYSRSWTNVTLSDEDGTPFEIWLNKGANTLELTATTAPYDRAARETARLSRMVSGLYVELKMITGNTVDTARDWKLYQFAPDAMNRLNFYAKEYERIYRELKELCGGNPDAVRNLLLCAEQIRNLMRQPDMIPMRYNVLSESQGSILFMAGEVLAKFSDSSLKLDKFYLHGDNELPRATAGVWLRITNFFSTLFHSFRSGGGGGAAVPDERRVLDVWVARARQYTGVQQALIEARFSEEVHVRFAMLPDEAKLTLSIAAGDVPDVVMGLSSHLPYNLAVRNALVDLKEFDSFNEVISRFAPGAVIPGLYNGGCFALPETQFFYVLFYRRDIMEGLDLPIPDTWDDVLNILPSLHRNGMNFFLPLSTGQGVKPFNTTLSFYNQFGASLYTPDGSRTAIDSPEGLDAMRLMTRLYTLYNVPLQVPSFYNKFRSGEIPLGIATFGDYLQLTVAAPEIAGMWSIAPVPGIMGEDGVVNRSQPGLSTSTIILQGTENREDAWTLLDWWSSPEIQTVFGETMFAMYGQHFGWNTSTLEAFAALPWPEEDKAVILEQWEWLEDVPHMPGSYMLEREISNAWNAIVFSGVNLRRAVDDAVINTNREMARKLTEFGYMENGVMIRTIRVPCMEDIFR
jgi:ABC-type glycerol-3-phosphate transport system substrate-binding protein